MRIRGGSIALTTILAALAHEELAIAQTPQQYDWCIGKGDPAPDLRIGACTALIQSGKLAAINVPIAFSKRGDWYIAKGDYDRAIADYSEAIQLGPKYANATTTAVAHMRTKKSMDAPLMIRKDSSN